MDFLKNIFELWQPSLVNYITTMIQSLLILVIGWWGINKICNIFLLFFQKTASETAVASFLDSIIKFSLRMILIIMVLGHLGLNVTSLLAAIGAAVVAIGIALKENISNLVSGIILVISKPIHVGDYIEFESLKGTVIKIEMLFTTLQSKDDGKTIIIPNARLVANNIARKSDYDISELWVCYEADAGNLKASEINKHLEKEFVLNNKILQIPKPIIETEISENKKITLKVKVWSQNQHKELARKDVETATVKLFSKFKVMNYNKL